MTTGGVWAFHRAQAPVRCFSCSCFRSSILLANSSKVSWLWRFPHIFLLSRVRFWSTPICSKEGSGERSLQPCRSLPPLLGPEPKGALRTPLHGGYARHRPLSAVHAGKWHEAPRWRRPRVPPLRAQLRAHPRARAALWARPPRTAPSTPPRWGWTRTGG